MNKFEMTMSVQEVLLVNEQDEPLGTMEKMAAHEQGLLHRAFSVFVFDGAGRMLLQQRAAQKYHGGGLWTNTCCSHPYPDEAVETAARRRLQEEMGFETPLEKIFAFTYRADVENGLVEHEYDHVFAGQYDGPMELNAEEVADSRYMEMEAIEDWIIAEPAAFTSWFRIAFPMVQAWWQQQFGNATVRKMAEKV
ncbi:isopentenyl-diphosphate Delta-isomerase [Paracnuella aquatica]|uniref:isopentenyl-diphosphate Delta-isomerase n=1 Tax=Paracnuella aquatica TaxID=2268757 RepID=UPI001F4E076C|nr:isopentenyl-diphosphate Delta-isomerase [Paracnuella aquatica]